jgi:hypothetical protein
MSGPLARNTKRSSDRPVIESPLDFKIEHAWTAEPTSAPQAIENRTTIVLEKCHRVSALCEIGSGRPFVLRVGHPLQRVDHFETGLDIAGECRGKISANRVNVLNYNLRIILALRYNVIVAWDVEVTHEFKAWWGELGEAERISVGRAVLLPEERGPHLPFRTAGE